MYNSAINRISNYSITFLQDSLWTSIKEMLSKRVAVVAFVALSCLAALYFVSQCCSASRDSGRSDYFWSPASDRRSGAYRTVLPDDLIDKIKDPEPDDVSFDSLEEEQKRIRSIKQNWLDDPAEETQRLSDAQILTQPALNRIKNLIARNVNMGVARHNLPDERVFMVVGRVLELKKLYRKSNYVFTHGQSPQNSIVTQVINECIRIFTPHQYHLSKIAFRVPHTVIYSENAENFINKYNATDKNFAYADNSHNAEMISVDACFWNTKLGEAALNYFQIGRNVNDGHQESLFKSVFFNYIPDDVICTALARKACIIAGEKKNEAKIGTLYAICIPKELVQDDTKNFSYRCHPYGKRCDCFPADDRIKVLDDMQNNIPRHCRNGDIPQFRLLTSRLTEEKDVRTFAVEALPKDRKKYYKNQVKELVSEANQYSLLYDLIETLEEDPGMMDQINSLIETSPLLEPQYIQHLFAAKGLVYRNESNVI